jgi:protein SCO1/2
MTSHSRTVRWLVWGFFGAVVAAIFAAYVLRRPEAPSLPVYGPIGHFALTNQSGQPVTLATLHGNVWIANVIFTRCSGPCAKLTSQMRQIQTAFPETAPLRLVSLTADPAYDTPEVLRHYAKRFQADPARWHFLTGAKAEVYSVAINELKFTVIENEEDRKPDEDLFIHSQKFVVVDRNGRIRAYIDGDEPQTVPKITSVVAALLRQNGP